NSRSPRRLPPRLRRRLRRLLEEPLRLAHRPTLPDPAGDRRRGRRRPRPPAARARRALPAPQSDPGPRLGPAGPAAGRRSRLCPPRSALAVEEARRQKSREIYDLESELAALLCRTPYVLLLSCPGLNVANISDIASELGPIGNYASAKGITGRAGLRPSRQQSGQRD